MSETKKVIYIENVGDATGCQLASHLVSDKIQSWKRLEVVFLYNKMKGSLPLCAAVRVPRTLHDMCWQRNNSVLVGGNQKISMSTPENFRLPQNVRWIQKSDGTRLSAKGSHHWSIKAAVEAKLLAHEACNTVESITGDCQEENGEGNTGNFYSWDNLKLDGDEKFCYAAVDCGTSLMDFVFKDNVDDVIGRALQSGVQRFVLKGSSLQKARKAKQLTAIYPGVMGFTTGYHPQIVKAWRDFKKEEFQELASDPACVAIGECGLDFTVMDHYINVQMELLHFQLQLACELGKPVLVCEKYAKKDLLEILSSYKDKLRPGSVAFQPKDICDHDFVPLVNEITDLGHHLVLTGEWWESSVVCNKLRANAPKLEKWRLKYILLASNAPSDAPLFISTVVTNEFQRLIHTVSLEDFSSSVIDLVKGHCSKQRNEPCSVQGLVELLASAVKQPPKEIADICLENSKRFFKEAKISSGCQDEKGVSENTDSEEGIGGAPIPSSESVLSETTVSWKWEQKISSGCQDEKGVSENTDSEEGIGGAPIPSSESVFSEMAVSWKWEQAKFWLPIAVSIVLLYNCVWYTCFLVGSCL